MTTTESVSHNLGSFIEIDLITDDGQTYYLGTINECSIVVQANDLEECKREIITSLFVMVKHYQKTKP